MIVVLSASSYSIRNKEREREREAVRSALREKLRSRKRHEDRQTDMNREREIFGGKENMYDRARETRTHTHSRGGGKGLRKQSLCCLSPGQCVA